MFPLHLAVSVTSNIAFRFSKEYENTKEKYTASALYAYTTKDTILHEILATPDQSETRPQHRFGPNHHQPIATHTYNSYMYTRTHTQTYIHTVHTHAYEHKQTRQ